MEAVLPKLLNPPVRMHSIITQKVTIWTPNLFLFSYIYYIYKNVHIIWLIHLHQHPTNSSITHAITHKCHFYRKFYFRHKCFMPFDFVRELFSVKISCNLYANLHAIFSIPMQFANVLDTKICCRFFQIGFCSSNMRQYYGSLVWDMGILH